MAEPRRSGERQTTPVVNDIPAVQSSPPVQLFARVVGGHAGPYLMRSILAFAAAIAIAFPAAAQTDEHILQVQPGGPYVVGIGSNVVAITKQRPLPNAFGSADIFGRKVQTGSVSFQFLGRAPDGGALIRRIDVDIHSTASTMSRSPGFVVGQSQVYGQVNPYGGTVTGSGSTFGMAPTRETNTVMPPRVVDFTVPTGQAFLVPSGHEVHVQAVQPDRGSFVGKSVGAAQAVSAPTPSSPAPTPAERPSKARPANDWKRDVFGN